MADAGSNRALAIGLAPGIVVAVAVVVGVLATGPGRYNNPAPAESATGDGQAGAAQLAAGQAAGEVTADQVEITAVMKRYTQAQNDGDAASFRTTLCKSTLAGAPEFTDGPPLKEQRGQIDSVAEVRVTGSTATAVVTASFEDQPELGSKASQLLFVNEDGWKLCSSG